MSLTLLSYRRKCYGYKAFLLGLNYWYRELKLRKVWAGCYESNLASQRILEKIGFVRDRSEDTSEVDAFNGAEIKQLTYVLSYKNFLKIYKSLSGDS